MDPEELSGEIERCTGRCIDASSAADLAEFLRLLVQWNARMNLVGSRDWKGILHHLVLDSLFLAELLREIDLPEEARILDVGAGAGIPGLPLRCLWTRGEYRLIEPRQKRAAFLQFVLSRIALPRTEVHRSRLEDLSRHAFAADLALSRGVRRWPAFLDLAEPYLLPQGLVLVFSAEAWSKETRLPDRWVFLKEQPYQPAPSMPQRYFWLFGLRKASS
jgi:16S rRNA (guanine527-N7)-methyltransferase